MLEPLISSKIRRSLFEYLLTHPETPFYLRGLAKELDIAVSPLRRELKRLEQLGVLTAHEEGNMLFYHVEQQSPFFLQIKQAVSSADAPAAEIAPQPLVSSTVISHEKIERIQRATTPAWRKSQIIGVVGIVCAVVLLLAGVGYLIWVSQKVTGTKGDWHQVAGTAVQQQQAEGGSGRMRSSRFGVMPGAMGGFSSGAQR